MKPSARFNPQWQRILSVLVGVIAVILALFWSGEQGFSWAAPGQSPHQQTVPPRTPTPTPALTPLPPAPTAIPPTQPPPDTDDDNDGDGTSTLPPGEEAGDDQTGPPVVQPPGEEAGHAQEEIPSGGPAGGQADTVQGEAPPAQPPAETEQAGGGPVTLSQADLSLSKVVDNPRPQVGQTITFTVVVSNSGPAGATNVVISDPLPAQLALRSAIPGQGRYQIEGGLWPAGIIANGQRVTLTIVALVLNPGAMTNTAEIIAADQPDPDSIPANGLAFEDDQASVLIASSPAISPASPPDDNRAGVAPDSTAGAAASAITGTSGLLYWLYALILGVILILAGLFLVHRA